MKKFCSLIVVLVFITMIVSCRANSGHTDISYSESTDSYSMKAHFPDNKMRTVENYMDDRIGKKSNMSFVNTEIDGTVGLDDHATFYMEKSAGALKITLDKNKNSNENIREIKFMCEGIKEILTRK